jgi:hypothetical protein
MFDTINNNISVLNKCIPLALCRAFVTSHAVHHTSEINIFFCAPAENPVCPQDTVAADSTKTSVTSLYC